MAAHVLKTKPDPRTLKCRFCNLRLRPEWKGQSGKLIDGQRAMRNHELDRHPKEFEIRVDHSGEEKAD